MTLKAALYNKQPPSRPLQQHLRNWLATAPEVAAEAGPFRLNGTGHASDDADHLAA